MNIALRGTTKIVLFALIFAGLFLIFGYTAYGNSGNFKILPNEGNGCWQGPPDPGNSIRCCINTSGPGGCDMVWDYQTCGEEGLFMCDNGDVNTVQDFVGFDYCRYPWQCGS